MKLRELKIDQNEQGTMGWRLARLGVFTGTRIGDLMSAGRKKDEVFGNTAISMIAEVAGERRLAPEMLGDEDAFQHWSDLQCRENAAMRHGKDSEDYARTRYEIETGNDVKEVGMVHYYSNIPVAASPDGLVLDKRGNVNGVIEIKSPSTNKTFQRYCWFINDGATLKAENPGYYWQVMANMMVTGAKWCDFVIYSPFHQDGIKVVRIERDEESIALIEERVKLAEKYINEMNNGRVSEE